MRQKLSALVMRRVNLCNLVLGAIRVQGAAIAASLGEVFAPLLKEDETPPDLAHQLDLYGRKLQQHCDHMVEADEVHLLKLVGYVKLRAQRGALTAALKEKILSLRSFCEGLMGESSLPELALNFKLAQDPKGVLRQAEILWERLQQPGLELKPTRWTDSPPDPESVAREFEQEIGDLRQTQKELIDQQRQTDVTVVTKKQAIGSFDESFIPLVRLLESTFRVAGHIELADRIRPTVRRLRQTIAEEEKASESEAEPEATSETAEPEATSAQGEGSAKSASSTA